MGSSSPRLTLSPSLLVSVRVKCAVLKCAVLKRCSTTRLWGSRLSWLLPCTYAEAASYSHGYPPVFALWVLNVAHFDSFPLEFPLSNSLLTWSLFFSLTVLLWFVRRPAVARTPFARKFDMMKSQGSSLGFKTHRQHEHTTVPVRMTSMTIKKLKPVLTPLTLLFPASWPFNSLTSRPTRPSCSKPQQSHRKLNLGPSA